ncbi:hypothetical protein STANM309S_02057 [Streptomyces tanashiensis]
MSDTAGTVDEAEATLRGRLMAALSAEAPGRPLLVLVEGPAGTGKSRLVERLREAAPGTARRVALGEPCPPTGRFCWSSRTCTGRPPSTSPRSGPCWPTRPPTSCASSAAARRSCPYRG